MSGEAASRSDITLPAAQIALFEDIKKVNDQIIVTLYNGRPLDLNGIDSAKALVEAWFGGTETGNALAAILWGDYNPSARLSMSFPESVGQVPIFYNCDNTGRPYESAPKEKYVSKYLDVSNYAKYPFGFGLSYSQFSYQDFVLDQTELTKDSQIKATVTLTNNSETAGTETVQLYIQDLVGQVVRPIKELKAFQQVELAGKESRKVSFTITEDMLRYVHKNQAVTSDKGTFLAMVGPNSRDLTAVTFNLVK